jgi:acetyltransferase-like isoleucine patch superfamily enzyme
MGAIVDKGRRIGAHAHVGAGVVVSSDLADGATASSSSPASGA